MKHWEQWLWVIGLVFAVVALVKAIAADAADPSRRNRLRVAEVGFGLASEFV